MELATIIIAGLGLVWAVVWGICTRPRRKAKEFTRKKIKYVENFLAEASKHLGYVAGGREMVKKGLAENPKLHALAQQARTYLSPASAEEVEKYSHDFFKALVNLSQPHGIPEENYFKSFTERLNKLKSLLSAEIS